MLDYFYVVKVIAISHVIVVIILLILAYLIKIGSYINAIRYERMRSNIWRYLMDCSQGKREYNQHVTMRYKRHSSILISTIKALDDLIGVESWFDIRRNMIEKILLPRARRLAKSRRWSRRYFASQSFTLHFDVQDEEIIKTLIHDPIPLVAVNAATLAIQCHSQILIDTVIDKCAEGRRIQQSLYAQLISKADADIIPLVQNRLRREINPYVKEFCYRTLTLLPFISAPIDISREDAASSNMDLKLAVLAYFRHNDPKGSTAIFLQLLEDSHWEVRAKSAKLLGEIADASCAAALEQCLKDPEWWVRMNAAEALSKLGEKGMLILKKQSPHIDQFAYDIAAQFLSNK